MPTRWFLLLFAALPFPVPICYTLFVASHWRHVHNNKKIQDSISRIMNDITEKYG